MLSRGDHANVESFLRLSLSKNQRYFRGADIGTRMKHIKCHANRYRGTRKSPPTEPCPMRGDQPHCIPRIPRHLPESTNDLATFAARRSALACWRTRLVRSRDVSIVRRRVGAVPFPRRDTSGITKRLSPGRIGQISQAPSQHDFSLDSAAPLSSSRHYSEESSFERGTVVVGLANRRRYLRLDYNACLVNKRAAGTAHRRSGEWRYYADLPDLALGY